MTDTPATNGATTSSHVVATSSFNKFDTSVGALTAVEVKLTSTRQETTTLVGSVSGTGTKRNNATNGVSNTVLTAPGITSATAGQPSSLSQSTSCGTGGTPAPVACPRTLNSINIATNATFNVGAADRASYAGSGSYNVALSGLVSALNTTSGSNWSGTSDTYKVTSNGNVAVTYSYDQHSEASFNSNSTNYDNLTIDFGTVGAGSHPDKQFFQIFNLLQTDPDAEARLALDFAGVTASGDTGTFSFDTLFAAIFNQESGEFTTFGVGFDTTKIGKFTATYNLSFLDHAIDGAYGFSGNSAVLTITGNVVPEPASLALIGGGLLLAGAWRRRKLAKKA